MSEAAWLAAGAFGLAFALAALGTRLVLGWLLRRQILDRPNERSSHAVPVPRGGGLAVTPVVAGLWLAWAAWAGDAFVAALGLGGLGLMALSWVDDRRGLPPLPRLALHALAVGLGLALLPADALVLQGAVPPWADRLLAGLAWLWFVNLYNFMDGIDGITGTETAVIGVGAALVAALAGLDGGVAPLGLAAAGAGVGFLLWNWHPARLFLGDSGSVPLGFLLGGLLVALAAAGQLAAALILPALHYADATITLLWRLRDGEAVWQPHRRHFYQRALRGGRRHDAVVRALLGGNLVLVGCAAAIAGGWTSVGQGALAAGLAVGATLARLSLWAREEAA